MKRAEKVGIAVFVSLVTALFTMYVLSDHQDQQNYWKGAPATVYKMDRPVAVDGPGSDCNNAQVKAVVDRINQDLPIVTMETGRPTTL